MKQSTLWFAILLAWLAPACAQEQPMRIRCELSMSKTLSATQPAELTFAIVNTGPDVVHILNWQTPFEGIAAPMFDITRDGADVDYRGRMLKRSAPRKDNYFLLKPGERREATINLADAWDVEAPGTYSVQYAAELFDVVAGTMPSPRTLDDLNAVPLSCNPVTFTRLR